jgi:hypothetical protein
MLEGLYGVSKRAIGRRDEEAERVINPILPIFLKYVDRM